ncbi:MULTISPECIES: DoxX family protein [unclassified Streptomyces]|uniref:DoxX family protein n=1 Tax=unclassified Streptomyces TaxID=2593676 RepID=UPI002E811DEE|nr:DoxX family protein [Streptomyces sp. NBC_00569]WSE13510.1 DoxX family protein [Streptomyces sp. NBC_01397]WUB97572.1 DoxX family protein [Streptomyces sp. NBC_00569]
MYRSVESVGTKAAGSMQSLVRIVVGFLFACHGAASLFGVMGGAVGTHGGSVPLGAWPGWWAAVIQLVGGILVALGLFIRPTALICSGSMAYAYFTVHQPTGLLPIENNGEPSALYAWIFLMFAAFGPGPWALERLRSTTRKEPRRAAVADRAAADA